MGKLGREIAGEKVDELIRLLNKALADEWLAYYQYWTGALVATGPMRPDVAKELSEHANEEKGHADMLANRIIELGGKPILEFSALLKEGNCGYAAPTNPSTKALLAQNIKGERCVIGVYIRILKTLKGSEDYITFNMIRKILEDEVKHEEDLENLQEDIKG
ncbi:MAG: ferritin-like domain-containing protein [archaeon]